MSDVGGRGTNLRGLTTVPGLEGFSADAVGYCGPDGCVVPGADAAGAEARDDGPPDRTQGARDA